MPKRTSASGSELFVVDKDTYLKSVNGPMGVKPVLKAWMELN